MTSEIIFEKVQIKRGHETVLENLTAQFQTGRVVAVVGANGAGKSTLLACAAGDLNVSSGALSVDGQSIVDMPLHVHARWRAVLAQPSELGFSLRVREVIEIGLHAFGDITEPLRQQLIGRAAKLADVALWLDRHVTSLSAGQLQRVHLARALVHVFAIRQVQGYGWLLLDEPVSNQDPWQQQRILHMCRELCVDQTIGVVIVLHDLSLVCRWCDDVVALANRQVVAQGPVDVALDQNTIAATFGEQVKSHFFAKPVKGVVLWSDFNDE